MALVFCVFVNKKRDIQIGDLLTIILLRVWYVQQAILYQEKAMKT